jgi:hypothetical protein
VTPREKAQTAVQLLESAIIDLLQQHPKGLRNIEVAEELGLRSLPSDSQKNQWSWQALRRLRDNNRVHFNTETKRYTLIE